MKWSLWNALCQPEEIFSVAHVGPVVFSSDLLEVQGDKLRLVVVDRLEENKTKVLHVTPTVHATEEPRWPRRSGRETWATLASSAEGLCLSFQQTQPDVESTSQEVQGVWKWKISNWRVHRLLGVPGGQLGERDEGESQLTLYSSCSHSFWISATCRIKREESWA